MITCKRILSGALLIEFMLCGQSFAQEPIPPKPASVAPEAKPPSSGTEAKVDKKSESQASPTSTLPPVRRAVDRADYEKRRIVQLRRLWNDVKARIILSPEQVVDVDRRFEAYIQYYKEGKYNPLDSRPSPLDPGHPEELREIYANLEAAKKKGNLIEMEQREEELTEYLRRSPPIGPLRDQRFLGELGSVMKPDQFRAYVDVVARWRKLHPRVPGDDAYRRLYRAVDDPDLKVTEEQKQFIDAVLSAARKRMGPPGERKVEQTELEAQKAKEEIFTKLTDEQKKQVEKTIALYKEDDEVYATMKSNAPKAADPPVVKDPKQTP